MAKLIPAAERIQRARALIQKARELPIPADGGKYDFSYIAQVKDLLRQARELVIFIQHSAGASTDIKADAALIKQEADQADKEILH